MNGKILQLLSLAALAFFSLFAADVYAPSIPSIALDLNTNINNVQWTMSIYMFGIAAMQFFYGAMSEAFGRKIPMIFGVIIMLIGSIICVRANDISTLILGRLVQGIGISACACLWRSIFRDYFAGDELAKYASYFTMIIVFITPLAPMIGGFIQDYFGWRMNFVIMIVYAIFTIFILIFGIKETSANHKLSNINIKIIVKNYMVLLKSPIFMGVITTVFLTYGAFFSWFVISPVILIDRMGISPSNFGIISCVCGIIGCGMGGFVNGKFVKKYGISKMLRLGWGLMSFGGVLMFLGHFIFALELWSIVIPVTIFFLGTSLIWPNAFATAFTPFGHMAGYAAALYGTAQVGGGAVFASIFAYLPDDNQLLFSIIIITSAFLAWSIYEFIVLPNLEKK